VTALVTIGPSQGDDAMAVHLRAEPGSPPALVGYISSEDRAAFRKVLKKVRPALRGPLQCRALIQGGVRRQDGSATPYRIRLILPVARDLPKALRAARSHL
jgi:hypothetical protein